MAGYTYPYRSSSVYNSPRADDWSKTSYASDHVCRPVIIDAEGRKRPIVSFGPAQNSDFFVTKTETIVQEHVISPFASEHKHNFCSPLDGCGVVEETWNRSSSPVHDRPPKVNDFITKLQTEGSRPRFGPVNAANWQKSNGNAYRSDSPMPVEPASMNGGGWSRPSHSTWGTKPSPTTDPRFRYTEPAYPETFDRKGATPEPSMITHGGWLRPSRATWSSPPPESSLSKPTSDINAAIGILKEAVKPSVYTAPHSSYNDPGFTETIDSREAARRYGKFNFASRPYTADDNYSTTIDSREAARKYRGTAV